MSLVNGRERTGGNKSGAFAARTLNCGVPVFPCSIINEMQKYQYRNALHKLEAAKIAMRDEETRFAEYGAGQ